MKYWTLALLVFSLAACSKSDKYSDKNGVSLKVQVPVTNGKKYSLSPVELFTITNLKNLSGFAAQFFIEPQVVDGSLTGKNPTFRYIVSNGVVIPTDALSLQLATVYTHMEKLRNLDEAVGAKDVNVWPRKVAVQAHYATPNEGTLYNNALYSGQIDAMIFVPYTQADLPLMVNAGVIGHEHFHSLFYKLVVLPLGDKYPGSSQAATIHDEEQRLRSVNLKITESLSEEAPIDPKELLTLQRSVVLRGINEGLADVWGWIYSNDVDFVQKSLPQEKSNRNISFPLNRLSSLAEIQSYINIYAHSGQTMPISYNLGNQFARAIKMLTETIATEQNKEPKEVRLDVARLIVKMLPELQKKVTELKEKEALSPIVLLELFSQQLLAEQKLTIDVCGQIVKLTPKLEEASLTSCQKVLVTP